MNKTERKDITKPISRNFFIYVLVAGLTFAIASNVFKNWGDFKQGFRDGYNFTKAKS